MAAVLTFCDVALPFDGFPELEREAISDGHAFLTRMRTEWLDHTNRFDTPGECLLGACMNADLIAIGGLNRDPFTDDPGIGRLRHIYVRRDHRRHGVASKFVNELLAHNSHFGTIRLRTPSAPASQFYECLGFTPITSDTATHAFFAT